MNVKQLRKILKKYKKKDRVVLKGDNDLWVGVDKKRYDTQSGGIAIKGYDEKDPFTVRLEL